MSGEAMNDRYCDIDGLSTAKVLKHSGVRGKLRVVRDVCCAKITNEPGSVPHVMNSTSEFNVEPRKHAVLKLATSQIVGDVGWLGETLDEENLVVGVAGTRDWAFKAQIASLSNDDDGKEKTVYKLLQSKRSDLCIMFEGAVATPAEKCRSLEVDLVKANQSKGSHRL